MISKTDPRWSASLWGLGEIGGAGQPVSWEGHFEFDENEVTLSVDKAEQSTFFFKDPQVVVD